MPVTLSAIILRWSGAGIDASNVYPMVQGGLQPVNGLVRLYVSYLGQVGLDWELVPCDEKGDGSRSIQEYNQ